MRSQLLRDIEHFIQQFNLHISEMCTSGKGSAEL